MIFIRDDYLELTQEASRDNNVVNIRMTKTGDKKGNRIETYGRTISWGSNTVNLSRRRGTFRTTGNNGVGRVSRLRGNQNRRSPRRGSSRLDRNVDKTAADSTNGVGTRARAHATARGRTATRGEKRGRSLTLRIGNRVGANTFDAVEVVEAYKNARGMDQGTKTRGTGERMNWAVGEGLKR